MAASAPEEKQWGLGPITRRLHDQLEYNKLPSKGLKHFFEDINEELIKSLTLKKMFEDLDEVKLSLNDQLRLREGYLSSHQEFKQKEAKLGGKAKEEAKTFQLGLVRSGTFVQNDPHKQFLLHDPESLQEEIKMIKQSLAIYEKQPDLKEKESNPDKFQKQFEAWDIAFKEFIKEYNDISEISLQNKDFLLNIKLIVSLYDAQLKQLMAEIEYLLSPESKIKLENASQSEFLKNIATIVDASSKKLDEFILNLVQKYKSALTDYRRGGPPA